MKVKILRKLFSIIVILMFVFVGLLNILNVTSEINGSKTRNGDGIQDWSEPIEIAVFDYRFTPSPPSIAVDSDGDWHVVYSDLVRYEDYSERTFVRYISNTTTEILAEEYGSSRDNLGEGVGHPSIAIDSNGGLHVTYVRWMYNDTVNQSIMYITKEAGSNSWSAPEKITTFDYCFLPSPVSIAVDSNGDWHIVYPDRECYDDNSETRYVKYFTETTNEILAEIYGNQIDETGGGVGDPSIAIDDNGGMHITYNKILYEENAIREVMYITKNPSTSSWPTPIKIDDFEYSYVPSPTSIAVDSDGDWHVVYPDRALYEEFRESTFVKYANKTSTETLAENFGAPFDKMGEGVGHPSIATDSEGGLHVVYIQWEYNDPHNQSIRYIVKEAPSTSLPDTDPDSDQDGLPDAWELSYFGNLSQDAGDDYDEDGDTNLEEYEAGTNPTIAPTEPPPKKDGSIFDFWWVFLVIIVLFIVFVAALFLRRKPPPLPYSAPGGEGTIPARYDVYR